MDKIEQKPFDNKDFIKKITDQLTTARNQTKLASRNIMRIKDKIQSLGCHTSSTMFGSSLSGNVHKVAAYKYHLVKWQYAVKTTKKREDKFSKLIARINSRKCQ